MNLPDTRNQALDFFRGLALLIIFVNHVPGNELLLFTPSRFGLSDAAEIFVFCSGYAAAVAYGGSFRSAGLALGSLKVFVRCLQIYAAHLALFGMMAMVCVLANHLLDTRDYIAHLNIRYFFDQTEEALRQLITLRYVPNYFDILPMYLVIMLWIPGIWIFAQFRTSLGLLLPVAVYVSMWLFDLQFLADPVGDRPWFFNPYGWQLLFFIGFGFGAGWLTIPARSAWLVGISLGVVLLSLPFGPEPALRPVPFLQEWHGMLLPWLEKTRFGPLRLVHFLALAYLATAGLQGHVRRLSTSRARFIVRIGQQILPLFIISMVLSYIGGIAFDLLGHSILVIILVNGIGVSVLMLAGVLLSWLRTNPWKRKDGLTVVPNEIGVPGDALPWSKRLRAGAALAMALLVAAGPIVLTGARRAVDSSDSGAIEIEASPAAEGAETPVS